MDYKIAISTMWQVADKPERMRCFHKIISDLGAPSAEEFWTQFWNIWQSSENLHEDVEFFVPLIRTGLKMGSSHLGLDQTEQTELELMADKIAVYRGAINGNQNGWSWTTDRDKARWFAERAPGTCTRYVMKATVNKKDVLAYLTGRNESEVVINPELIHNLTVDEKFDHTGPGDIFYAVQSGKLFANNPEMDAVRAEMAVSTLSAPFDKITKDVEGIIKFLDWCEIPRRRNYYVAILDAIRDREANPNDTQPRTFAL